MANYDRYGRAGTVRNEIAALFQGCYEVVLSGVVFGKGAATPHLISRLIGVTADEKTLDAAISGN